MNTEDLLASAARLATAHDVDPWHALVLVLIDEISPLKLPTEVAPAFDAARQYWAEPKGGELALQEAKATCWAYIDAVAKPDVGHVSGRRVRALLCVMEPTGDQQAASDTADWFADMTARA